MSEVPLRGSDGRGRRGPGPFWGVQVAPAREGGGRVDCRPGPHQRGGAAAQRRRRTDARQPERMRGQSWPPF
eukprot:scaffold20904_cov95-Isochrysis_galbana.AAC.4